MADLTDSRFAELIGLLESLESAYVSAVEDSERNRIKDKISGVVAEMREEHIVAYRFYMEERTKQAQSTLERGRNVLKELQSERERRQRRS